MVPLFDTKAQHQPIEAELLAAFQRLLRSGQFILGNEVLEFERQIAELVGVRHAVGTSSGTDAILLALMALEIGPGDEVICPSFTFFATAGCISRLGAVPVFVDSCPVCFNLDVADAARKITKKTKAILPVHLFGQAAAMDAIMALAQTWDLPVIEDSAQALGAEFRGRKVGGVGTFGAFSFFPTKNLGGFGDGGMLVTNDDALAERARLLRTHGAKQKYFHELIGANFRLDALQATLLRVKLPHYQSYTDRRRANAAYYTQKLGSLPGVSSDHNASSVCPGSGKARGNGSMVSALTDTDSCLILPTAYPHNTHIWNQYTLRVPGKGRRDELRQFLSDRGVGAEVYYPVPLHRQACFASLASGMQCLPVCEILAQQCLSIPIYPELTRQHLDEVVAGIADFLERPTDSSRPNIGSERCPERTSSESAVSH